MTTDPFLPSCSLGSWQPCSVGSVLFKWFLAYPGSAVTTLTPSFGSQRGLSQFSGGLEGQEGNGCKGLGMRMGISGSVLQRAAVTVNTTHHLISRGHLALSWLLFYQHLSKQPKVVEAGEFCFAAQVCSWG